MIINMRSYREVKNVKCPLLDLVLLSGEEFNHEVHEGSHEVTQRRMLSCS